MQDNQWTVHEVAKMTGVTVRTLHYYDSIDLLKPIEIGSNGYRFYNRESLQRLQSILLFRELRFPLKQIKEMLNNPNFNQTEALEQQIHLLELQRQHIDNVITLAKELRGTPNMTTFDAFDTSEIEQYEEEIKQRWGNTDAYREYTNEMSNTQDSTANVTDQFMAVFTEFGKARHLDPQSEEVQQQVRTLQDFITEHYYTCTDEVLSGLGEMYAEDDRFRKNIDKAGGAGTAEFVRQAIRIATASRD